MKTDPEMDFGPGSGTIIITALRINVSRMWCVVKDEGESRGGSLNFCGAARLLGDTAFRLLRMVHLGSALYVYRLGGENHDPITISVECDDEALKILRLQSLFQVKQFAKKRVGKIATFEGIWDF